MGTLSGDGRPATRTGEASRLVDPEVLVEVAADAVVEAAFDAAVER